MAAIATMGKRKMLNNRNTLLFILTEFFEFVTK